MWSGYFVTCVGRGGCGLATLVLACLVYKTTCICSDYNIAMRVLMLTLY